MKTLKYYVFHLCTQFKELSPAIRITILLVIFLALLYIICLSGICIIEYKRRKKEKRYKDICNKFKESFEKIISSPTKYTREAIQSKMNVEIRNLKNWERANIAELILSIKQENETSIISNHNSRLLIDFFSLQIFWEEAIIRAAITTPHTKSYEKLCFEEKNKGYYLN